MLCSGERYRVPNVSACLQTERLQVSECTIIYMPPTLYIISYHMCILVARSARMYVWSEKKSDQVEHVWCETGLLKEF